MDSESVEDQMKRYFARKSRHGGLVGGRRRWEGVSVEERRAHAQKAAAARWRRKMPSASDDAPTTD